MIDGKMKLFGGSLFLLLCLTTSSLQARTTKIRHFKISNLENVRFNSKRFNNPVIISFFFIDCVPCRTEIPRLFHFIRSKYPKAALLFVDPIEADSIEEMTQFSARLKVPASYFYPDPFGNLIKKFGNTLKKVTGQPVFPQIFGLKQQKVIFHFLKFEEGEIRKIREIL